MNSMQVAVLIQVSRKPSVAKTLAWAALVLVSAIALAWGFLQGHLYLLVAFVPFAGFIAAMRRSARGTEMKRVTATVEVVDGWLRILLPATRLYDDHYVDQFYQAPLDAVEAAEFDTTGTFHLRARRLESYALDNGAVLDHRSHEFMEVSFKVDGDAQRALTSFLKEMGI